MERIVRYITDGVTDIDANKNDNKPNIEPTENLKNINSDNALTCPSCGGNFSVADLTDNDDFVTCLNCKKVFLTSEIFPKIKEYRAKKASEQHIKSSYNPKNHSPYQVETYSHQSPITKIEDKFQSLFHTNEDNQYCSKWVTLILCYFFGIFGAHKFYEGNKKMGKVYLFTLGLFFYGWLFDILRTLFKPSRYPKRKQK